VEALANAIGLWRVHTGLRVINVVHGQEQLIVVFFRATTVLRCSISKDAQQRQLVLFEVRQYTVIQISPCSEVCPQSGPRLPYSEPVFVAHGRQTGLCRDTR